MKLTYLALCLLFLGLGIHQVQAQRPLGVDVSSYQGSAINWTSAKNAGIVFAWAKATEGLTTDDADFVINQVNAKNAGVYIGAYHYAHPETHVGLAGADQEAAHFWGVASNYIKGSNTYMMPVLDIEANVTGASPAYTAATLSAWVNEWCNVISNNAAAAGVTIRPIVYTFAGYAKGTAGYGPGFDSSVTSRTLWMAQYPLPAPNPQVGGPSSTAPWGSWNFWQYSSTNVVPGIPGGGDVDVFNGTLAGLSPYVIGGTPSILSPSISSFPLNHKAIDVGSNVTFAATATGNAPLYYQWTLNGVNVANATNATINITNAQPNQTGNYALVVTNAAGSVTSSVVSLIVYPLQATVFADNFDVNSSATWTLNQSSGDNSATFAFDYSSLSIPSAPHSTGGTTKGLQMKANLTLTNVAAVSLSPVGQTFSGDYRIRFDGWINVNGPYPAGGSGSTEFLTSGLGTAGNRTEWTGSGSTADGYYFAVDGDGGVSATSTTSGDYIAYVGTTIQATSSGVYFAGTDTSVRDNGNTYYTTLFPTGKTAPSGQLSAYPVQSGTLATGTFGMAWHDVIVSRRSNIIDWVIDGVRIASITNSSFTASNVFVGFWDQFPSLSANNAINFGLVDNVRVEQPAVAPVLTLQPVSKTNGLTTSTSFSASATGLPTPAFQWLFNGTNIPGATSATYALSNLKAANAGLYSVVVTNIAGTATSTNATLTVTIPSFAFQSVASQPGGVQLQLSGSIGSIYAIDFSTNLTNWSQIITLTNLTGTALYTDGVNTNYPAGFYRARFVGP